MTKRFEAKAGDKWKSFTDGSGMVRYADNSEVRLIGRWGIDAAVSASSVHGDPIDLPTPDALAQLREWGYVVTGDEQPITEARVREIVSEMLAAHPTPAEVREAAKVASDPKTEWVELDDWQTKCKVWQPTPGDMWAVHSPSRKCHLVLDDPLIGTGWYVSGEGYGIGRNFKTEADARAALAKAPPPPDVADFNGKEAVAPEPDWKGLLEAVCDAADFVIDTDETPERNCSCHIHPPCSDCEEYAGRRQAIDELNAALAAAREYLARTNGGVK